jgi:glucuronate isomerase
MKITLPFLFVTSIAISHLVNAAEITRDDVTSTHINVIKNSIEQGCKHRGREVGDNPENVDAFCDCVSNELNKSMTENDWKDLIVYATSNRTAERDQLLANKMISTTAACKK